MACRRNAIKIMFLSTTGRQGAEVEQLISHISKQTTETNKTAYETILQQRTAADWDTVYALIT